MDQQTDVARCLSIVETCNGARGWGLNAAERRSYAEGVSRCISDRMSEDDLFIVVGHYHAQHRRVAALRDALHPQHVQEWEEWMPQVIGIIRAERRSWSTDRAVEEEDLAQVARIALAQALPSYRYRSRLSTWAYRVVVQSVQSYIRGTRAEKRATRPDSLNDLPEHEQPLDPVDRSEEAAQARLLADLINTVLGQQGDKRLVRLFQLAYVEDRRISEIGKLINLHPSRVRALLQQARAILRDHPDIQRWRDSDGAAPAQAA